MIQEIITYIILAVTIITTIVKIFRFFAKKQRAACSSCAQAKSGCKAAALKDRLNSKPKSLSFD